VSTRTTYAGKFGPLHLHSVFGVTPNAEASVEVKRLNYEAGVYEHADLYTDRARKGRMANPVSADNFGALSFHAEPGNYLLIATVAGALREPLEIAVDPDPAEPAPARKKATDGTK
jgi:hypothetical protein